MILMKTHKYTQNTVIHIEELKSLLLKCNLFAFSSITAEYLQKFEFLIFPGSVATCQRWGGWCHMGFVANFIRFPALQKLWKLVKIWQSYNELKGGNFFRHNVCVGPMASISYVRGCENRRMASTLYTQVMGFCLNEETSPKLSLRQVLNSSDRLRRRCIKWVTKSWGRKPLSTLVRYCILKTSYVYAG